MEKTKKQTLIITIIALFTLNFSNSLWSLSDFTTDITVQSIKDEKAPKIIIDSIIFTYKPDRPIRYVGLRFEHENFKILHLYQKNRNGIFVLVYPIPENLKKLRYRIVVDGLWMKDPTNTNLEMDKMGTVFSVVKLKKPFERFKGNPTIGENGRVTFKLKTNPGKIVTLSGDFNHWDPFMTRMKEVERGVYTVTVEVLPGRHYYYYNVDGEKLLDPLNTDLRTDYEGFSVSSFFVPGFKSIPISVHEGN